MERVIAMKTNLHALKSTSCALSVAVQQLKIGKLAKI